MNREEILARITAAAVTYGELAGDLPRRQRAPLRALVDQLLAEGAIKIAMRHARPHFVLPDYHPEPAYLLEMIKRRSTVDDGGCLIWGGYIDPVRGPMARAGEETPTSVRRMAWVAAKRGRLGYSDIIYMKCAVDGCVELRHMKKAVRGDSVRNKPLPVLQRRRIALTRRKGAKLTVEVARAIRESDDIARVAAEKAGISKSTVADIRAGRRWKDYGGFFTGLVGR